MKKSLLIASLAVISMNVLGMLPNDPNGNLGEKRKRNYAEVSENIGESNRNVRPRTSTNEDAIGIQNYALNVNSSIGQLNLFQSMQNVYHQVLLNSQSLVSLFQQQAVREYYEKQYWKQLFVQSQQEKKEMLLRQSLKIEELESKDSYNFLSVGKEFPKLKKLTIQGSDLSRLSMDSIKNLSLPNLTELHISHISNDNLNKVNELISKVSLTLQQFELVAGPDEKISVIPDVVWICENLIRLKLKGNISSLPPEIGNLINLKDLNLSDNQVKSLPPEIGKLINLKKLNLSDNQVESLPPEIGKLINLKKLNLEDNQVESLPPEIGNLVDLEYLNLDFTNINKQPQEIWKLKNLKDVLFRDGFSIRKFIEDNPGDNEGDDSFMYWAKKIDLSDKDRDLTTLPIDIIMCENVEEINLRNNRLPEMPDQFVRFSKLQRLDVGENDLISSIDKIKKILILPKLETVVFSAYRNEIPEIERIENDIATGILKVKYKNSQDEDLIKVLDQEDDGKLLVEYTKEGLNRVRREMIREKKREITSLLIRGISSYLLSYRDKVPMNKNQWEKRIEWWTAENIKMNSLKHMVDILNSVVNNEMNSAENDETN